MATPVGRIEKEFLLKVLYDEKLPIKFIKDRVEFVMTLDRPAAEGLALRPMRYIAKLKANNKMDLLFNYRGQVIEFSVDIDNVSDDLIFCKVPDVLYKNLDRNYLRVDTPSDLKVIFTFSGDRYNLSFPKVTEYANIAANEIYNEYETSDLTDLVKQIINSMKKYGDGYKIVNFKDKRPEETEERIVSETGKSLFIPSTGSFLPKVDPYPKKRIITEEIFKRYLESTGVSVNYLDENCARFLRKKYDSGIISDAWVPILFHEYVIGYIHIWRTKESKFPFDFSMLDNIYQYSKVLAFALKENGYFDSGKILNKNFAGKVVDISASGLLFACPPTSNLINTLLVDSELTITIEAPNRTVNANSRIVRRFKDRNANYFGCRFINMAPEDTRFLFEHLYGRHIEDSEAILLTGQV